jgi:hypothetical protein
MAPFKRNDSETRVSNKDENGRKKRRAMRNRLASKWKTRALWEEFLMSELWGKHRRGECSRQEKEEA